MAPMHLKPCSKPCILSKDASLPADPSQCLRSQVCHAGQTGSVTFEQDLRCVAPSAAGIMQLMQLSLCAGGVLSAAVGAEEGIEGALESSLLHDACASS